MATTILKILMTVFCLQVLIKFYLFFFVKYDIRRIQLDNSYCNKTSVTKVSDYVLLTITAIFVTLLFFPENLEYLSFITGLYVGATFLQVYFHRFSEPLPYDKAPLSPINIMFYSLKTFPKKPWKVLTFLTLIFS